ncbi:hypothetical protein WKI22_12690 [Acinetobacter baumannii]|nr:hypothetical protein [Acinetobacter baumannii]
MLFNFFKQESNHKEEKSSPYLTKELSWDEEKIIAVRFNGTQRTIYYKNIIRIEIIITDLYLPVPKWVIQDDNLEDHTTIDFYNDIKPSINDLVVDMFNKKIKNYDNQKVHEKIIEAMGASSGLFHLWSREDLDQVLNKIWDNNKDKIEADINKAIKDVEEQGKSRQWWKIF